ncbi:MAG: hypothetical protein U9N40_06870, partial [Euryarchaeota archaeon]|nr:hypothetical protein [Euryarchaeota archaeon]
MLYDEFSREERRAVQSRQLMRLDKRILTRLEKDGFIRREKQGRNVFVSATETGLYAASGQSFLASSIADSMNSSVDIYSMESDGRTDVEWCDLLPGT